MRVCVFVGMMVREGGSPGEGADGQLGACSSREGDDGGSEKGDLSTSSAAYQPCDLERST